MSNRDKMPAVKLGMYLRGLNYMVTKDEGQKMVKQGYTELSAPMFRRERAVRLARNTWARTFLV